ncbi:MAG: hypothetical protein ACRCXX_05910, partial [Cetobacterium sp.]|uniref:hypothetical protein n=1 Tax=Cetobacterium sp. TaxID=2071632 RepID=UPI003F336BD0
VPGVENYYFAGFDLLRNSNKFLTTDKNEAMLIESKEDIIKLKGDDGYCVVLDKRHERFFGNKRTIQDIDKVIDEYTGLTLKEILEQGQLMEVIRKTVYPHVPGEAKLFKVFRLIIEDQHVYYKYTSSEGKVYLTRNIEEAKVFRKTDKIPIATDSCNWEIEYWHTGNQEYIHQRVAYVFNDFGNFDNYLFFFDAKFVNVTSMYEIEANERIFNRN